MSEKSLFGRVLLVAVLVVLVTSSGTEASLGVLDSTYIIFHAHGTDTTSRLGAGGIVPLGDINGDGYDDIAIGSFSPSGTYVFYGGDPVDEHPDMFLRGGYPLSRIDLTGDGVPDVATLDWYFYDAHYSGKMFFYRGYPDSISSAPYDSLFPKLDTVGNYATNWGFGSGAKFGFIDGDAHGDLLAARPDELNGPALYYYSGGPEFDTVADWSFRESFYDHGFSYYGFIDFDGDGAKDVFVGAAADLDTLSFVYIFKGSEFGATPDIVIADPADLDTLDRERFAEGVWNVGDVNGDGWDDLGVKYNFVGLIYYCGPGADTLYDMKLQYGVDYMSTAGDVNDDSYNDLVNGSALLSAYGTVDLYLGGPRFDGNVDDGMARADLPSLLLDEIGYRTAPAGDFNGDGIHDFMFACQNLAEGEPGDVFVIKGSRNIVTDVDEEVDPAVPERFRLQQNYPNPFNSSTTIEFELGGSHEVSLVIYSVLGQNVRTIVRNETLPIGQHRFVWNGLGENGKEVATGVYLCRLIIDDQSEVRKMLLVK